MTQLAVNSDPVGRIVLLCVRSAAERRCSSREVGVVDGGAVDKPRSPPAVRSSGHHGVVTARQNGKICASRMTLGKRNVYRIPIPR